MVVGDTATWKANYFTKLTKFVKEYPRVMVVGIQNVRSSQLQQIRIALRGKAELLMGKNTMMRKAIRVMEDEHPDLQKLLPFIELNIGLCFTKEDPAYIRDLLLKNTVEAPAKLGSIAPKDVFVPAGPTGMGPEKTSFFQALNISTKIAKGVIEIINDVHLIKEGDKVGPSEAALLQMLDVRPFEYGLSVLQIYDNGSVYSNKVLNIKASEVVSRFLAAVQQVAAVSLAIGYPTAASAPHSIANAFKNLLAVAVATEIDFKEADKAKAYLANPSAFAVAAAPAAAAPAAAAKAKAPEPEPEEEEAGMDFDLFG
jgi:large subunit ribosomal protein LP0